MTTYDIKYPNLSCSLYISFYSKFSVLVWKKFTVQLCSFIIKCKNHATFPKSANPSQTMYPGWIYFQLLHKDYYCQHIKQAPNQALQKPTVDLEDCRLNCRTETPQQNVYMTLTGWLASPLFWEVTLCKQKQLDPCSASTHLSTQTHTLHQRRRKNSDG